MSQQHKKIASNNGKIAVPRNTRFAKSSAHRCEKQAETRVRRAGKQESAQ